MHPQDGDENKQVRDKDDHACDNLTEGGIAPIDSQCHQSKKRQERGKITEEMVDHI